MIGKLVNVRLHVEEGTEPKLEKKKYLQRMEARSAQDFHQLQKAAMLENVQVIRNYKNSI